MQLIWTVALSKWLSSRHIFSDDCALGHMWAFSSNPGLCGDGWTPVNTWYSLSRAEGGQGFDKILYHGALHKVSIVINSITMHKNAFLHREPSLISFLLCKKNAIVLDIGSRIARFHCLWCCKFLLQASISSALVLLLPMGILILAALLYYVKLFRHINKKVTRHDTNKNEILKKTVEMIQGQFQNSSYLQYSMAVWCVLSICHQAIYLSLWFLICGWKLFRGYAVLGPYKIH